MVEKIENNFTFKILIYLWTKNKLLDLIFINLELIY